MLKQRTKQALPRGFGKYSWPAAVGILTIGITYPMTAATPDATVHPSVVTTGKGVTEKGIRFPIPSLPGKNPSGFVDGVASPAPFSVTNAAHIHEGVFSDGLDLADPPQLGDPTATCPGTNFFCAYQGANTSVPHASTPDFGAVLGQAISDAQSRELPKLDAGVLGDALKALQLFGGSSSDVRFASGTPTQRFLGYQPEFGRWLHQNSVNEIVGLGGGSTPGGAVTFADPLLMSNLRERGARLYCAARQAQNKQSSSTKSMGKLTAFSVKLFGQNIDFMTVEPTLVIDGPQPYLGGAPRCPIDTTQNCSAGSPNDGAQAFMVPFLVGTQITPVSFLPSLPEIRVPVAMVTGDSEVLTPVADSIIEHDTYQTVTHSDAILSSEITGGAASKSLLYSVGPVQIFLDLGMGYGVGQLFSSEQIGTPNTSVSNITPPAPPVMVPNPNDRVLDNMPAGWPVARSGDLSLNWDEGAWLAPSFFTADTTTQHMLFAEPNNAPKMPFQLAPSDPFLLRGLEDDDRRIWNSTTLGLLGGVHGELSKSFDLGGFASISATVSAGGNLTGNLAMRHTLRDAAISLTKDASRDFREPISAVTIEPSVNASANLDLFVDLDLTADINLILTHETVTIFNGHLLDTGPITLTNYESGPWPEASRFRLGTGSSLGDPLKAPVVPSHFPDSGGSVTLFASFPAGADVDSCLANPAANNPAPPPCQPQPPVSTTPPSADMCVYTGSGPNAPPLPPNVCSGVAAYVSKALQPPATAAQRQCLIDKLDFLCQPTSQEQKFAGAEVLARIFDPTDAAEMKDIHHIVTECVGANPGQSPQAVTSQLFQFGLCDAHATLFTPSQAASLGNRPSVTPGTCQ